MALRGPLQPSPPFSTYSKKLSLEQLLANVIFCLMHRSLKTLGGVASYAQRARPMHGVTHMHAHACMHSTLPRQLPLLLFEIVQSEVPGIASGGSRLMGRGWGVCAHQQYLH